MRTGLAYIDPGAGSLLAQAAVAGVAGLAVAARACLQRLLHRRRAATVGAASSEEYEAEAARTTCR